MSNIVFTTKHIAKWRLKIAPHYIYSTDDICYNMKTGRVVKQVMKCSTIGYIIEGKFKSVNYLRNNLESIQKEETPF